MKNNRSSYIFFLTIFVFLITSKIFPESEKQHIEWKPIDGAHAYKVEVRDSSKKMIFEKTIRTNKIEISLPTGRYEHRIGVLNKFSKILGYSNWYPINVIVSLTPIIDTNKKISGKKGEKEFHFTLEGNYFFEEMKVSIEKGTEKIPVTKLEILSDGKKVQVVTDLSDAKLGVYDIVLENPKKKITKKAKFLLVKLADEPTKEERAMLTEGAETTSETKTKDTETPREKINYEKSLWGALWRSAVLPGWGHVYGGNQSTGYIYGGLFLASLANVYAKREEAVRQGKFYEYKKLEDYAGQILPPSYTINYSFPVAYTLRQYHASEYAKFKREYYQSIRITAGLYLVQLFHSYYSARNFDRRMWSVVWRSLVLPGWGQIEAGNKNIGYTYLTLFGASFANLLSKQEKLRIERASYENNSNVVFGLGMANLVPQALLLEKNFRSTLKHADRNYHQALNVIALIYAVQFFHSFYSGNAYENSKIANYTPGKITPMGISLTAVPRTQIDKVTPSNQLDYQMQMNFIF